MARASHMKTLFMETSILGIGAAQQDPFLHSPIEIHWQVAAVRRTDQRSYKNMSLIERHLEPIYPSRSLDPITKFLSSDIIESLEIITTLLYPSLVIK